MKSDMTLILIQKLWYTHTAQLQGLCDNVLMCYLVSFQSPRSKLLQGWQHHYIILHLWVRFHLYCKLLLYIFLFCCNLNYRKTFCGIRFFLEHWWSKLYPCHSILKHFLPNYFQILTSSGVVMHPGEMRGSVIRLSGLIPVSGSLYLRCRVFRERGGE